MKEIRKIRAWQLVRLRTHTVDLDLSDEAFVTVGKRAACGGEMESVVMPSGLSTIKAEAFLKCKRLKSVTLPCESGVGISVGSFRGCERLQAVEPFGVVSAIGARAFEGCTMLTEILLGKGLRRIGDGAFRGCRSLKQVALLSSLEHIGRGAFRDCTSLVHVDLDASSVAEELFRGCLSLVEVRIPATWVLIPDGTFRDCTALREIEIPTNVQRIGKKAFRGCRRLTSVSVALGVQKIGAGAFTDTPCLREILVPHSVRSLGHGAFGTGRLPKEERMILKVENEYMARRLRRMLFFCGSARCAVVEVIGKSIEERKRERRRSTIEKSPTHLADFDE